jgi:hypothetical protein
MGQMCCPGSPNNGNAADYCLAGGLACSPGSHMCVTCGGGGQPCCDGNSCTGMGCCDHSAAMGQCVASGSACGGGAGNCANGACGTCGGAGQMTCGNGVGCTAPFTREQNGNCVACGDAGGPCCRGVGGDLCKTGLACGDNGMCATCGGNMQPCCPGSACPNSTAHSCVDPGVCQ